MYKTVSLLTANTVGHGHYNKFLCVCCKKSFMSVDLISHFTPQKIFNKSKRKKKKRLEGQNSCPRSLKWSPPKETGPKVLEGSLKKLPFVFSHPFSVQRSRTSPCCLELNKSALPLPARKQSGADP